MLEVQVDEVTRSASRHHCPAASAVTLVPQSIGRRPTSHCRRDHQQDPAGARQRHARTDRRS